MKTGGMSGDTRRQRGSRSLASSPSGGQPGGRSRSRGDRSMPIRLTTRVGTPHGVSAGAGRLGPDVGNGQNAR